MGVRVTWKRKPGPFVTWGRAAHAGVGTVLVVVGFLLGGDGGAAAAVAAGATIGFLWEKVTHRLAPYFQWGHPFGDLADALAFAIGGVSAALVVLFATGG